MFVSAGLGMTLKLPGGSQYEFLRPSLELSMLDTDQDIDKQLEAADVALEKVWKKVDEKNDKLILQALKETQE